MVDQQKYLNLIVRYLDNPQNKQLHFAITAFRAGSATNEAYFREVERIWLFSSRAATLDLLNVGLARLSQNSDSWITKELTFVDTPLEEVCRQLSDCYGVQITFKEGKKANKRFNATFKNDNLKDLIKVIRHTYNITITQEGDNLVLKTP